MEVQDWYFFWFGNLRCNLLRLVFHTDWVREWVDQNGLQKILKYQHSQRGSTPKRILMDRLHLLSLCEDLLEEHQI